MKCPFCSHPDTQVVDTRALEEGGTIRRRRRCESCDRRFTTYEHAELIMPAIVKKNGSRVDYNPQKLRDSMRLALRKRPVSAEAIEQALLRIEDKLLMLGQKEVRSDQIGELVMTELKGLDKIAYIRFASVYKSFEDVSEFGDMLREFSGPTRKSPA